MPLGVPSSATGGLSAPQSAEVAAAAAASVSLAKSVRKAEVATVRASSGATFKFEAAGEAGNIDMAKVKEALAVQLGAKAADITLTATDPTVTSEALTTASEPPAAEERSRRRRMSMGSSVSLKAYVATDDSQAMLTTMRSVASDTAALSAALNISVTGATAPELLQVSADGTELSYHPWHVACSLPYELLIAALLITLTLLYLLAVAAGEVQARHAKRRAGSAAPEAAAPEATPMLEDWAFDESACIQAEGLTPGLYQD